jgi:hypothetical protein
MKSKKNCPQNILKYTFKKGHFILPKMVPRNVLSPMGLYKVETFVKVP